MTTIELDWQIRHYIYQSLIATGKSPSKNAIASHFAVTAPDVQQALRRLHEAHALVLKTGSDDILMANPLSAVPTDYQVYTDDVTLYANCAWDSLGIPAMLGCDARIEARHPYDGELMRYAVYAGQLESSEDRFVHFAHPFRYWYDDIVDT